MTTTTTTAQLVAELLDGDGARFADDDGTSLAELCERHGARRSDVGGADRWQFADESAIVVAGGGWDFGFFGCAACRCWAGVAGDYPATGGHNPECEHAPLAADWIVGDYTARYDDAMTPRVELEAGEHVLAPEQPDGREWAAFRRRMHDAGLELRWCEHVSPEAGDLYELVEVSA